MPAPSTYTEPMLALYMRDGVLRGTASVLGWEDTALNGPYQEAVNETLLTYGVADIATVTDISRLRALARIEVWRLVVGETASDYNWSADGGQYSRAQMHDHAVTQFEQAQRDAAKAGHLGSGTLPPSSGALRNQGSF